MKKNLTQTSKTLLALVFFLSLASFSYGQVPSFFNYNAGNSANSFPLNTSSSNKVQWVYSPLVFNSNGTLGGAPAYLGLITTVYFRAGSSSASNFTDFSISLAQNVGTQANWTNGTYNLGMTQVISPGPQSITALAGNWFSATLQTPFLYDPTLSLIVEMKQNGFSPSGITVRQNSSGGAARIWGGYANTTGSFGSGRADFGFDLLPPTPCDSLATVAGSLSPNNPTICTGQALNFTAPTATLASGLAYQWQSSPNGIAWTNIGGATNVNYQTPPIVITTHYRLIVTCTINSVSDTSSPSMVTVSPPTYVGLPYSQDFEQWASYCDNSDVPNDYHWSNAPSTSNNSWRREDEGPTAIWSSPVSGLYFPSSSQGNHSARFHSFSSTATGRLDLYVDCSSSVGNKTLSFDYINDNSASGTDNLLVEYSTNGGTFFLPVAQYSSSISWQSIFVSIPSNTANTIIRFTASGGSNSVPGSDIGIDNLKVLAPCVGAPVAGTIDSVTACPNKPLVLNISGGTLQGGVNYRWESSPNATGPWTFIGNSAGPTYSTTITTPTYWRCILTCQATTLADTTSVRFVDVLPFYICYCDKAANTVQFENIGNVNIRDKHGNPPLLNNGNPIPTLSNSTSVNPYTLFQNITPPIIYRDSAYYVDVSGISFVNSFNNCWAKVYIDYNRDGVYNVTSELALSGAVRSTTNYMAIDSFIVPSITNYGLTGMRVILQEGGTGNTVTPCGSFGRGEVEDIDYIVDLQLLPCNSPPNSGTSYIDDSTVCINNTVRIVNNTHDRFYANLNFSWQESTDGVVFNDIPSGDVDTMFRVVSQDMWYRYRTTCSGSSNAYSNAVFVRILPPAQCIGVGSGTGPNDKSDIGAIVISETAPTNTNIYTFSAGGPHLSNPASYKFYTNYTAAGPLDLFAAHTYKFSVYHIMNTAIHTDAQVSIFIDFNGNQVFDTGERVYNGSSTASNFFLNAQVNIPGTVVVNTPVIMRVVLNEDLGPNPANDTGLGSYVSGETEDFYLRFNIPVSTTEVYDNISNVGIYPNPTPGVVNVDFNATESTEVNIEVVSLTGSVLRTKNLGRVNGTQNISLDLTDLASGVYMMRFTAGDTKFVRKITVSK